MPLPARDRQLIVVLIYLLFSFELVNLSVLAYLDGVAQTLAFEWDALAVALGLLFHSHPAFRRMFGTPSLWNPGMFAVADRMMEQKPSQFKEMFRMHPRAFKELERSLWSGMYPTAPDINRLRSPDPAVQKQLKRCRWVRNRGPHATPEHFRRRLLATLYYLGHGVSFIVLSSVFGMTLDKRFLLVEQIASMKSGLVRWPKTQQEYNDITQRFAEIPTSGG